MSERVTKLLITEMRMPTELLELFLNDDVIELIATYSNLYAAGKSVNLSLTDFELKCFLWDTCGFLHMSTILLIPERRIFCEQREDSHSTLISTAMRRDRFETILLHLHVAENVNLDPLDKFAKLQHLINKLNEQCMKFVPNKTYFNTDESMVPYMDANNL
ncbi:UNVERIFIED_CONTAM: PiggyBac transposable element-derived protein 3 [Trichonephila clavipes]